MITELSLKAYMKIYITYTFVGPPIVHLFDTEVSIHEFDNRRINLPIELIV